MTPKEFSEGLMRSVIEDNLDSYQDIFENTRPDNASDPYWKKALTLYEALSSDEKIVLFSIMRQISIDTTSNILGIIDGVNTIGDSSEEFSLLDGHGTTLNGDLQSFFLVEEERLSAQRSR